MPAQRRRVPTIKRLVTVGAGRGCGRWEGEAGGGSLLVEGVRVEAPFDEEGKLVQPELLAHERWHRVLLEPKLSRALH